MQFLLDIITPERQVFSKEVSSVSVPTANGTVGVLPRHTPLFSALTEGEVKVTEGNREYFLAIGGGFMEVTHDRVSILVSRAAHADELNETEIRKAQDAAQAVIARKAKGVELSDAQAVLRRSLLELRVLRRRRSTVRPSTLPTSKN
jgi:F-type H+-transporting ATPase subunit epsilon